MLERENRVFAAVIDRIAADRYTDEVPASRLVPLRPASIAMVMEAEQLAGRPLPPLLRRCYLEIGNGGFGPGYGLLGLPDGHQTGSINALTGLNGGVLTLCEWGCGISSMVDLVDGQVWGCDPNPDPDGASCTFPQYMTVVDWFDKWAKGTLYQPWLVQDPATGAWRGATDAEYAEMLEDAFVTDRPN